MTANRGAAGLPLSGIRVLEFTHMIMGPACGMVLADLGADVIKVEPAPRGDNSRRLIGPALGFFPTFNRNKRSLCVDLRDRDGATLVKQLAKQADVVVENFRPGAMAKLGFGYDDLAVLNPGLIYCACKGFLPGPYEHRVALDEVVQMMGGLAYMTGPPGQPLRAGASINDIMGGVFGVVAILAALRQRDATGKGGLVQSGLFETNMMLVAQHMAFAAIEGRDLESFGDPNMQKPWPIYDTFDTNEPGQQVFVGTVTESQWRAFCDAFGMEEFSSPDLTMSKLARMRDVIKPRVAAIFKKYSKSELMKRFEDLGLPYAPVAKPADMFKDEHLLASGGLVQVDLETAEKAGSGQPSRRSAGLPSLPISLADGRVGLRRQPPKIGEHTLEVAQEAGFPRDTVAAMVKRGTLITPDAAIAAE